MKRTRKKLVFDSWKHEPVSVRAQEDQQLLPLIRPSYEASYGIYGIVTLALLSKSLPNAAIKIVSTGS